MRPNRIAPASAVSSLGSRGPSSPLTFQIGMGIFAPSLPTHDDLVVQRKQALRAGLKAWCERTGQSRAQFADRLSELSGVTVTETKLAHWIDTSEEGLRWRMSAELGVAWAYLTGCRAGFDELLDEIGCITVEEIDAKIAYLHKVRREAEEELAAIDGMRRAV